MPDFSIAVALFDLLPVAASAVAMSLLAQAISTRHKALSTWAWSGMLLIVSGGLCKALWKLLVATDTGNIVILNNALFICLAPGLTLLAFGLGQTRQSWLAGTPPDEATFSRVTLSLILASLALAAFAAKLLWPETRAWFFVLITATTVANLVLVIQAVRITLRAGLAWFVSAFFVYNIMASLALGGLARLPAGDASAWIQECVNLSAQIALVAGSWHLRKALQQGKPG